MAYIGNSPANTGNYQLVDDIASSFNGSLVSFALTSGSIAITPAKSGQILANINGVMQEPDDGGTNGFKVTSSNIIFSSAPASGDTFWAVYQGQNVDIGTPSDDVVDTAHIKDDAVTAAKLANSINTEITANTTTANAALPKAGGTMTGDLILNDNVKLEIGSLSGGDLQIYHDASAGASYIKDVGTGHLQIAGTNVNILNAADSEYSAKFITDGAVELYHNNVKKLETTAAGATVTGNIAVTGTVDGVDIQTLNTTASAALPKAGGTVTGTLNLSGVVDNTISGTLVVKGGLSANQTSALALFQQNSTHSTIKAFGADGSTTGILNIYCAASDGSPDTLVTSVTANGLTFNGDTAAANALDDYEEGTWTPVPDVEGAGTITATGLSGNYTKIGRLVHLILSFDVGAISGTASSAAIQITGMPFSPVNAEPYPVVIVRGSGLGTAVESLSGYFNLNSNFIRIEEFNGTSVANLSDHVVVGSNFKVSLSYLT